MPAPRVRRNDPVTRTPHRRKLSNEDAETRSIVFTKDRWGRFPPPTQEFAVRAGRQPFITIIVAEDCDYVSPPHQHLHPEAGHFADRFRFPAGSTIEIAFGKAIIIRNG